MNSKISIYHNPRCRKSREALDYLNKKAGELAARARDISKNVRCLVCQNQSIDESSSPLAKDLRILIRKKINIL